MSEDKTLKILKRIRNTRFTGHKQYGYCDCSQAAILNCISYLFPLEEISNTLIKIVQDNTLDSNCGTKDFIPLTQKLNDYFKNHKINIRCYYSSSSKDSENTLCYAVKVDKKDPHFVAKLAYLSDLDTRFQWYNQKVTALYPYCHMGYFIADSYPYQKDEKPADYNDELDEYISFIVER